MGTILAGVRLELRAARPERLEDVQGGELAAPACHLQAESVFAADETDGKHAHLSAGGAARLLSCVAL